MKKLVLSFNLMLCISFYAFSNTGSVTGTITDQETGEALIGSAVVLQGTTVGAITDASGNFTIKNIDEGTYNLVISSVSYDQQIIRIEVTAGQATSVNIMLKPQTKNLEEVVVTKTRRTDSDLSLMTSLKASDMIVSGISAQQISKTQDKDAAEVIRRVPGITISDGKFVIVRGLVERYNSVLLNGASAPSFEADKRAFSFDAIPSSMISNILIFKSPAPELPADFAGAAIDIITRNNADKNEFSFSYTTGYRTNTTFNNDFQVYKGGSTDWLGLDDGTRDYSSQVPSTNDFKELYTWNDMDEYNNDMAQVIDISKSINKIWKTENKAPIPDQGLSMNLIRRFTLGKVSLGNITSVNYKNESNFTSILRREYFNVDTISYRFNYNDLKSKKSTSIGLIHNWLIIYGRNQKFEFRNLMNIMGESTVSNRSGDYVYNSESAKITNLRYTSRFMYSGQVSGKQRLSSDGSSNLDWVIGYSRVNNSEPDNRRVKYSRDIDSLNAPYLFNIDREVNINNGGRLSTDLYENILNGRIDYKQDFFIFSSERPWSLKAGAFQEIKERYYTARLIGLVAPRGTQYLNLDRQLPIEEIVADENFYYIPDNSRETGIAYKEGSQVKNNYNASGTLTAGYLGLKVPITRFFDLYSGVRLENVERRISGFYEEQTGNDTLDIVRDTLNLFPSLNLTFNITEKHLVRFSYGKTINRPEFREMSNTVYEDFDLVAIVHGNPDLKDAYIYNYDLRYEWYPTAGEILSLAAFYKEFENPIEMFQIPAGTGFDYKPFNTEKAHSLGLELDIRKIIIDRENHNMTLVFNTSVISSKISTGLPTAREHERIMQGQSPYIINLGTYYQNLVHGFNFNLTYNRIGKRIVYAGTIDNPHTWELPRNLLDLSVSKTMGKYFEIRFGIKDILGELISHVQYHSTGGEKIEAPSNMYLPNTKYSLGLSIKL